MPGNMYKRGREECARRDSGGLHVRPTVLPAKFIPGVLVGRVVGCAATLLCGERVVVVVHDQAEIFVVDDATMWLLAIIVWVEVFSGMAYGPPGP